MKTRNKIMIAAATLTIASVTAIASTALAAESVDSSSPAAPAVDAKSYETAYAEFSSCMSEAGISLVDEWVDGVIHRYSYLATDGAAADSCYRPFMPFDQAWQVANQYQTADFQRVLGCLTDKRISPASDVEGVLDQIRAAKLDPATCGG